MTQTHTTEATQMAAPPPPKWLHCNGQQLKKLAFAALNWLDQNHQHVNALNVFPVPDGDTGTNMLLTMRSAYGRVQNSEEEHVGKIAEQLAHGALMGARGNSGVILSQIWRGLAKGLKGKETFNAQELADAFQAASETAYGGVMKPVEGTILTIIREGASEAADAAKKSRDLRFLLERVLERCNQALERTPEQLAILKQAGVVDSGGKGLFFFLEGMLRHIYGESLETPTMQVQSLSAMSLEGALEDVEEGQDYEVVVDFVPEGELDLHGFYGKLEEMGTSIQVGEGDGMYRMHIHVPTENRYVPIDYIMGIGTVTKVAIENLMAQMDDIQKSKSAQVQFGAVEPGNIAVVVVSPGMGISRIFASLGVAAVVAGGQTMNPSTQDILSSFENMPTDKVIILPNNKNIIMAANQAKEVTVKDVQVVPTRTIPQGLAAMLSFDPGGDVEAVAERMNKAISGVKTGEITIATRSVEIDGVTVTDGQVIALLDGKLVASAESVEKSMMLLLDKAEAADHEIVTLFYGEEMSHVEANRIADLIREKYPNLEVEVQEGGQPHYQFILSVE